jgi:hypothetical protein
VPLLHSHHALRANLLKEENMSPANHRTDISEILGDTRMQTEAAVNHYVVVHDYDLLIPSGSVIRLIIIACRLEELLQVDR